MVDSWKGGTEGSVWRVGEGWAGDCSAKNWGGTEDWGGTKNWCGTEDWGGGTEYWSGVGGWGILVYVGVESVDGISGVVHGSDGAVRFGDGVAALDDISVTGFSLSLRVSGQSVVD